MRLKVVSGQVLGQQFSLRSGATTLGGKGADIDLADPTLESQHARLEIKDPFVRFSNLANNHESYVNGIKVQSCWVDAGDILQLGTTRLQLESESDEESTAAVLDRLTTK